jgi:hypothetical protein
VKGRIREARAADARSRFFVGRGGEVNALRRQDSRIKAAFFISATEWSKVNLLFHVDPPLEGEARAGR